MVRVNRKNLEKHLRAKAWGRFLAAIKKLDSEDALILSLGAFLTPSEIIMLEKRLAIPILIERGLSYRAIGEVINVSPGTISFVKHNLTKKPVVHRQYSSFSKTRNRKKLPFLPPWAGHGRWLRAKLNGYD